MIEFDADKFSALTLQKAADFSEAASDISLFTSGPKCPVTE